MAAILLLAVLLLPMVEIALFVVVGGRIGAGATVAAVILTAVAGVGIARWQGLSVLYRSRAALANRRLPVDELLDGVLLLLAAGLLVLPGFFTDAIGALLLLPPVRAPLRFLVKGWFLRSSRVVVGIGGIGGIGAGGPQGRDDDERDGDWPPDSREGNRPSPGGVIDGEWTDVSGPAAPDPDPGRPIPPSADLSRPPTKIPDPSDPPPGPGSR